ncbi:sensor histidine kinase [Sulfurirhabdus autotrophica]|uniref:histidine kinase n=1 Tax=Sulfurirhabdus autotrophica TaxID=1706046 RepID=A0A4R3XVN7_9PROT|nr:ATP-binding protein [Sulfurirhabdus autotrophica]TCV80254.1 nitrogen fixation/metabolism regulation signal transduction histidine kinase [Sulfurirhabdus autotrophica]
MRYIVILGITLGAVLLYLLSQASGNSPSLGQNYPLLLALNMALAVGLMGLVGYQLWGLRRKIKAKVFGAKLTLRILVMLAMMALVPGAVVYGVSVQFLTKSIESWFDVRVDNALEGGLSLGQTALDYLLRDLNKKAESMSLALSDKPGSEHITQLNNLREQLGVQEATLFNQRGKVIAYSSTERAELLPAIPSPSVLRQVRQQQPFSAIESIPGKGLFLRVVVPVNVLSFSEDIRVLQLIQQVPKQLARDAEAVQSVYRDYQELSLSRLGLKRLYGLTLTFTLLFALLSAMALAFLLSEKLSAPLSLLAEGTRAVAKGDFSLMHPVQSKDELGGLMQSFNSMTRQLAEIRAAAELNHQQLETAKAYLESILAHLSSGVLTMDERFYLRTGNVAAQQILGVETSYLRNTKLVEWRSPETELNVFAQEVAEQFKNAPQKDWQKQVEYVGQAGKQVLLVRGTRLPASTDGGYIVVFDDITHMLQAQRDAAWGEVARRLAHEIKNPLTPIQLSAERLERKLVDKLSEADGEMLKRATHTIVNQVAALNSMVDAFKEYARSPSLNLQELDLNRLVREVLALYESMGNNVKLDLSENLPIIMGDMTLLRQVIHNLLQNAQDALIDQQASQIVVHTEVSEKWVKLVVRDNGSGFPEHILSRVFEPYVTTKQKGTGLGLAIVKKIVEEHNGMIQIENIQPHGACVSISLHVAGSV